MTDTTTPPTTQTTPRPQAGTVRLADIETDAVDVPTAAAVLGISKWAAYAAIDRGDIHAVRIGRKLIVPTATLRRMLDAA